MRGEMIWGPMGGTYFQPIPYVDFWGHLGLSLSSHNSSEKKVLLRFMDSRGAGGTHPNGRDSPEREGLTRTGGTRPAVGGVQGRSPA